MTNYHNGPQRGHNGPQRTTFMWSVDQAKKSNLYLTDNSQ